jgi:hypothetical protein
MQEYEKSPAATEPRGFGELLKMLHAKGRTKVTVTRVEKPNDRNGTGYQSNAIKKMVSPVALYHVEFDEPNSDEGYSLWSFIHDGTSFRFVGKMKRVSPPSSEDMDVLGEARMSDVDKMFDKTLGPDRKRPSASSEPAAEEPAKATPPQQPEGRAPTSAARPTVTVNTPPTSKPRETAAAAPETGTRSPGEISAQLPRGAWKSCCVQGKPGSYSITMTIAPDGSVRNAAGSGPDPATLSCMQGAAKSAKFKPAAESSTVSAPVNCVDSKPKESANPF